MTLIRVQGEGQGLHHHAQVQVGLRQPSVRWYSLRDQSQRQGRHGGLPHAKQLDREAGLLSTGHLSKIDTFLRPYFSFVYGLCGHLRFVDFLFIVSFASAA